MEEGGYPSQLQMGVPKPGPDVGYPGDGIPPAKDGVLPPPPRIEHHMKYLIHSGRYAYCVHTGGLSCFNRTFTVEGVVLM